MIKNPFDPENLLITQKVKEWIRAHYSLDDDIEILIKEQRCLDTSCMCVQTSISIANLPLPNIIIGKPLCLVRKWDIDCIQK